MATTQTDASSLKQQATAAYNKRRQAHADSQALEHGHQILAIRDALNKLGIQPAGDSFINAASHRPCVPLISGGWDEEANEYIHIVAAEWTPGSSNEFRVPALVADLEPDEGWNARCLYPAGHLSGLADLGKAIKRGGSTAKDSRPATARDLVDIAIGRAFGEATVETTATVLAAEAICTALLDVADAIREGR